MRDRLLVMGGVVVLAGAMAFARDVQEEAFPSFVSGDVVRGATSTWRNYVRWWNETQGTPLQGPTEIDVSLWDGAIAKLEPQYVYTHGINIVIVRSCRDGNEEGFYVALSIASSPGPNDEQFTRMVIAPHAGGTVSTFRRQGHFERTQAGLSAPVMAGALRGQIPDEPGRTDQRTRDIAVGEGWSVGPRELLERFRVSDRELMARQDLPEEVLAETSTDKLFRHYMDRSYRAMMTIASTPAGVSMGVQRILNASSTIYEFYMRPDLAEGVLKAFRQYDLSPESISDEEMVERFSVMGDSPEWDQFREPGRLKDLKIARISMNLNAGDMLLLSPQFFPKLKGHEKEFLAVLLERYDGIMALPLEDPLDAYGAAAGTMHAFCLRLAQDLDSELHERLNAIDRTGAGGYYERFMGEIRRYLEQ